MGKWRILAILCVFAIGFPEGADSRAWAASDDKGQPAKILKLRGKTIILYHAATGKKLSKKESTKVVLPLKILESGIQNNRYPVEIDGKPYWIIKSQVKKTDKGKPRIAAKCQTVTKAYASSRGLGNCK